MLSVFFIPNERLKSLLVIDMIMSYQLVLSERVEETTRDVGENVFFDNLPSDSEVYLFYYPGAMPNKELESKLREFGNNTGKNLFVNIGRLNDPNFKKIVNNFGVKDFPVIIVTANSRLASHPIEFETAYVKLDSKKVLNSTDLTIDCAQKLFLLTRLNGVISSVLKGVEFSISLLGGKMEVKWKGG